MHLLRCLISYRPGFDPEVSIEGPSALKSRPRPVSGLAPSAPIREFAVRVAELMTGNDGARAPLDDALRLPAEQIGQALYELLFLPGTSPRALLRSVDGPQLGEIWIRSDHELYRNLPWGILAEGAIDLEDAGFAVRTSGVFPGGDIRLERPSVLWIEAPPPGAARGLEETRLWRYARQWWTRPDEHISVAHRWSDVALRLRERQFDIVVFCGDTGLPGKQLHLSLGQAGRVETRPAAALARLIEQAPVPDGASRAVPALLHLHSTGGVLPAVLLERTFGPVCDVVTWSEPLPADAAPAGGPAQRPSGGPAQLPSGGPAQLPSGGPAQLPSGGPAQLLQKLIDEGLPPALAVARAFPYPARFRHRRGCHGAYSSWKTAIVRTGRYFSDERLARIDRSAQCYTVIGAVQTWLRNRHTDALTFVWEGRTVDGVDELQSRIPDELARNFDLLRTRFAIEKHLVSFPSDTGPWFEEQLHELYCSSLDVAALTDLSPVVRRYHEVDGILLYIGHTFVAEERPTADLLKRFFLWWSRKLLPGCPVRVWPVLGLGFITRSAPDAARVQELCPTAPGAGWPTEVARAWRALHPMWLGQLERVEAHHLMTFFEQEGVPRHWRDLSDFKTSPALRDELLARCEALIAETGGTWARVVQKVNGDE